MQQNNTTSEEEWIFEEVSKWAATIKSMTDDVGPYLVRSDVNESVLLSMQRHNLMEIGVTNVGSLALLPK